MISTEEKMRNVHDNKRKNGGMASHAVRNKDEFITQDEKRHTFLPSNTNLNPT
jgi:hypothetical protein